MISYRKEIDGLRAIAILSVVFFHASFNFSPGGFLGVDIFFVISGYLITKIVISDLEKGIFSFIQFYERRAKRILPALFFVTIATIPIAWFLFLPGDMNEYGGSLIAIPLFLSNIFFWRESGYFEINSELKPLLHTWSLAVEEQFYIFFPLFIFVLRGNRLNLGKNKLFFGILLLTLTSFGAAQYLSTIKPVAAFYLPFTRIWELLMGATAALYTVKKYKQNHEILSILGILLILIPIIFYDKYIQHPSYLTLVPNLGAVLILINTTSEGIIGKLLANKIFSKIGLISYSIYLWHQPLFAFYKYRDLNGVSNHELILLTIGTFVAGYLTWRYVEKPFRHIKISIRKLSLILIIVSTFLIISGLVIKLNQGNVFRFPPSTQNYFDLKAESDKYVWDLKNKLRGTKFDNNRIKILIIGDSNSGDLINSLSSVVDYYSISTLTIHAGCGNLYMQKKYFEKYIALDNRKICLENDDLFSDKNLSLLINADLVIFASSWREWELNFILQSYSNLKYEFGDKFYFFGNKHMEFLPQEHVKYQKFWPEFTRPRQSDIEINKKLRSFLGSKFIDPYDILCEKGKCKSFTNDGQLIQYDGFHLTMYGAKFIGQGIIPLLNNLLSQ